jgi:hypothetical protein
MQPGGMGAIASAPLNETMNRIGKGVSRGSENDDDTIQN